MKKSLLERIKKCCSAKDLLLIRQEEFSKEEQLEVVKIDEENIMYINNPDKDVQLEVVKQSGYCIKYINNPDKDVQLAAVRQNKYSIKYINNPYDEVIDYIMNNIED